MSVAKEIRKYTFQHYGNLISVSEPEFDDKTKTWLAELRSDYPRIIRDDRSPDNRILTFLSLERLGMIQIGENLEVVTATSREACIQNLAFFLNMWRERAERIIVKVSADHFARIDEAQWVLAKVGMIISNLLQKETIFDDEIAFYPQREEDKIRLYLKFLESLELVRRTDQGYTYGNLFAELRRQTGGIQEFKIAVLSYIIRESYSTLREVFGISQLETFVHVDSCYYRPALEAERLFYWTGDSIIHRYTRTYGRKSPLRLAYILGKLVEVKALEREDKYYFGNQHLFSQMLDLKNRMTEMGPPRA